MSTQDGFSIPFSICNDQQRVRLLELPPSLLELITSRGLSNLSFKSAAPRTSNSSTQAPANAVLCTDDQTYQVRQVQSSNAVFVVQPTESDPVPEEDGTIPPVVLSSIAQCAATLELVLTSPPTIAILKETLPIYIGPESIPAKDSLLKTSGKTIFEDVPFSRGEFDKAWKALCAFDLEGRAWIPAGSALVGVWRSVVSAATLQGVSLGDIFPLATLEGLVAEDDHPSVLFRAIIDRLGSEDEDTMGGYAILDREKTVPWVGATLLEAQGNSADGIPVSDFIQDWRNHLPEDWRKYAQIDMLKGRYSYSSKDRIILVEASNGSNDSKEPTAAKASSKGSRKWHDKFKDARR